MRYICNSPRCADLDLNEEDKVCWRCGSKPALAIQIDSEGTGDVTFFTQAPVSTTLDTPGTGASSFTFNGFKISEAGGDWVAAHPEGYFKIYMSSLNKLLKLLGDQNG